MLRENISVEVVDLSTAKYPNRDELRKAHDIYLDAMSQFVSRCLNKDIEENIEISRIAYYVRTYWDNRFESEFDRYYEARSATQLIVEGRNRASHPPWDLDLEFTRTQLFLIAELLGKIGRSDAQREVEVIRDKLFSDDTAERLAEAEQRLAAAEAEKKEYKQKNTELSEQVDAKEKQRKKLDRQVKNAKTGNDKLKKELASTKKRLEKSEEAHDDDKERLETTSKELKDTKNELTLVQGEKSVSEKRLAFTQNLLITAAIGDQSIFPTLDTNSRVRILDRRNIEKKNYLLNLLEQKQPTLIYVQSEEMVDLLLERVLPEKADLIEKHGEQTSETEEMEILKRLENGESIAVVSDTTFSTMARSHCVEHFVFCHLVPSLDVFFKQCEPAFTSGKNAYLHLIYNTEQDLEGLNQWLTQKYPDAEALGRLYRELKELAEKNGNFIKPENVYDAGIYSKLGMAKLGVETGLAIFEELQFLEQNKDGVKFLPDPEKQGLDESKIHCDGEELRCGIAEVQAFQLEQRIKNIWEEIQEKLDVDSEQILREDSIDEVYPSVSEIQSDQQRTETVENDSESDAGDSEANQVPKPERANAKVTEEQLREIQSRSAAGESNSELAKEFNLSPPAIRFVAETTEGTRNEIAVKVGELRINKEGARPIAWKKIREELGLHNDHFHQVIRHSEGYLNAVIERIKSLKSADGGWEYNGKLSVLTGIEDIENYLE